jgi:hypothetical protein
MRNALLVLALLSISCYVSAQQITPVRPAKSDMCPIGFGVQIDGRAVARTVEDEKKNGDGPLLELTFKRRDAQKILSANVIVHGLYSSNRYLPINKPSDENRMQTFQLDQNDGASGLTAAEVRVNQMLSVSWVEVTELKYSDGSAWHTSSEGQCRVVPSKLLLIGATAMP